MYFSWCAVATALIVASIFTSCSCIGFITRSDVIQKYQKSLDGELLNTYKTVVAERLRIYFTGAAIGLLLALAYLYTTRTTGYNWCMFAAIILVVQMFYYLLSPKSTYMVNHLRTDEQRQLWTEVYRTMQLRYISGMLVGAIGYFVLGYGLRM